MVGAMIFPFGYCLASLGWLVSASPPSVLSALNRSGWATARTIVSFDESGSVVIGCGLIAG